MLLVAGLASDRAFWYPVADALGARYQLILVDNRGSGRTTPLDAPTSIELMAEDCIALVRYLRLPRVDLVGHSMGGMIAQRVAATTAMAHAIPQATLFVMDGAAHSFSTESPAQFARHVLDFLGT